LVKRYLVEAGSAEVAQLLAGAGAVGTAIISRAETAAALARASRVGALTPDEAQAALQVFRTDWPNLLRLQLTELVLAQADRLAWEFELRGYDAVHLTAALYWQEALGEAGVLATFDRQL